MSVNLNKLKETNKSHFLYEIEGLRGILAIWVFICHLMWGSGFRPETAIGFWSIPFSGWAPVRVFIIISGFVIFLLIDSKKESYVKYITRRFFRLYPLFIVVTLFGASMFFLHLGTIGVNYEGPNIFARSPEYYKPMFITPVILGNLVMLHGLTPGVGPILLSLSAWSISLEWQFYLIAPFLFLIFRKNWFIAGFCLISTGIILKQVHSGYLINITGATLPDHIIPFTVGMLSYVLYQEVSTNRINYINTALRILRKYYFFVILSLLALFTSDLIRLRNEEISDSIIISIWLWVFFSVLVRITSEGEYKSITSSFLGAKGIQFLGKLSYSIYLIHPAVIFCFCLVFGKQILQAGKIPSLLIESILLIPLTVGLSVLSHRYIEVPGIQLGKSICSRIKR
jgi:peptidoglycan/LPS O-acetylase OafA/YrhL